MGKDRKVDSAWGARGQMTHSADSNDGLGGDLTNDGTGTRDDAPPDSQSDDQAAGSGSFAEDWISSLNLSQ